MNKFVLNKSKKISTLVLIMAMAFAATQLSLPCQAMSAELPCQAPPPPFPFPHPVPVGMMVLLDTMNINVVAKLTGEPAAAVKQRFAYNPGHALLLLKQKGVPFDAYRKAIEEQSVLLVNQAALAKIITKEQAVDVLKEIKAIAAQLEAKRAEEEILRWQDIEHDLEE